MSRTNPLSFYTLLLYIIVPLVLILLAAQLVIFTPSLTTFQLSTYGVDEKIEQDVSVLHHSVLDFFTGVEDTLPGFFSDREQEHLSDVRTLLRSLLGILILLFIMMLFFLFFALRKTADISQFVSMICIRTAKFTFVILLILCVLLVFTFEATFEFFHKIFFEEGTYTFDPLTEKLTVLYPEQYFQHSALIIAGVVAVIAGVLWFIGMLLRKSKRKS